MNDPARAAHSAPKRHRWIPLPAGQGSGKFCGDCAVRRTPLTERSECHGKPKLPEDAQHKHEYDPYGS